MIQIRRHISLCILLIFATVVYSQNANRERINFDDNWKFHQGHSTDRVRDFNYGLSRVFAKMAENINSCIRPDFNDRDWNSINLPHDWLVELPFTNVKDENIMSHGYKPVGGLFPENSVGWYRKTFDLNTRSDTTRQLSITFDGIYRDSEVWINGFYLGRHVSGYTGVSYDITDFVSYNKSNTIVVRVDATQDEGWFYEGAGIYRHVWLNMYDRFHFTQNGIFVYSDLTDDFKNAIINIETEVENKTNVPVNAYVQSYILNQNGEEITKTDKLPISLFVDGKKQLKSTAKIKNPKLWDLDSPHLYTAVSVISVGNYVIDKFETKFGVRKIYIDKDKGLFINGKAIKIQGVCCHQDHAGVGCALPDYLQYYRIGLLKEMGANAYRSSHNPPTPELLQACDSLGMLVLDETRILSSSAEYMKQWEDLVLRDRNHPSIFMWSLGNEEYTYQSSIEAKRITLSMLRRLKQLDSTRVATYGANTGNVVTGVNQVIPVRGFNYNLDGIDDYRKYRPEQPILGSEVGSTVSTRGVYKKDTINYYLTDFDENFPSWASTAEKWWTLTAERDWFMGGFVWTGFDYRGEPTPYQWPNINSHFGVMDMCGFPKNIYYYYQSWWADKDVLHIAPHWNWKGKEGETVKVWVNSNAQTVELFLNEKSLGRKEMPHNGHLNWDVIYKPGKLKAIGYKNNRKIVKTIETTGQAKSISLVTSKKTMVADGKDCTVINVTVNDEKGLEVPDANMLIYFSLTGDARIIGVGNGNPSCHESDKCIDGEYRRSLFNGKCQLIIQSGKKTGEITIKASSIDLIDGVEVISQVE